ncbi:hypothetical protein SANA_08550 [Gottschalkiaceae bacterium SANA]|nr:hypothetical protein SANA_08550 [Gottschalkiaceae bacterium SANA]
MKRILSFLLALLLLFNPLFSVVGESWISFAGSESGLALSPGEGTVSSMILGSEGALQFTVDNTGSSHLYNLSLRVVVGNGLLAKSDLSFEGVAAEVTSSAGTATEFETELAFMDIKDLAAGESYSVSIPLESMLHPMENIDERWVESEKLIAFGDRIPVTVEWLASRNPQELPEDASPSLVSEERAVKVELTPVEVTFSGGGNLLLGAGENYDISDNAFSKKIAITMKNNEAIESRVALQVAIPDGIEVSNFSIEPIGYVEPEAGAKTMNLLQADGSGILDFGSQVLAPGETRVIDFDASIFNRLMFEGEVNQGELIAHNQVLPLDLSWQLIEPDLDPENPAFPTFAIRKQLVAKELILSKSVQSNDNPIGYGSQMNYSISLKSNQYYGARDLIIYSRLEDLLNEMQIGQSLNQESIVFSGSGFLGVDQTWLKGQEERDVEENPTGIVWRLQEADTAQYLIDGLEDLESAREEINNRTPIYEGNDSSLRIIQGFLGDDPDDIPIDILSERAWINQFQADLMTAKASASPEALAPIDALLASIAAWQVKVDGAGQAANFLNQAEVNMAAQVMASEKVSGAVAAYQTGLDDPGQPIQLFESATQEAVTAGEDAESAKQALNSNLLEIEAARAIVSTYLSDQHAIAWKAELESIQALDLAQAPNYVSLLAQADLSASVEAGRGDWIIPWSEPVLTDVSVDFSNQQALESLLNHVSLDTERTGYGLDKSSVFNINFSTMVMENWVMPLDWSQMGPILAGDRLSSAATLDMTSREGVVKEDDSRVNAALKIPLATISESVVDVNDQESYEMVDDKAVIQVGDVITMNVVYDGLAVNAKQNLKEMFFILPEGTQYIPETALTNVISGGPAPVMIYDGESDVFVMETISDPDYPQDPSKRLPVQVDEGTKIVYSYDLIVNDLPVIVEGKEDFHLSKLVLETQGNVQSDRDESQFYYSAPKFTIDKESSVTDLSNLKGGQVLPFTITVENESRSSAFEVVVQDLLPDQLIMLPDTIELLAENGDPVDGAVGYDMESKILTVTLTEVPGASDAGNGKVIIAYEAGVVNPAPAELSFSNIASLVSYQKQAGQAPAYTDQPVTDRVTMTVSPFTVEKTVVDSTYRLENDQPNLNRARPGDQITYEISIQMEPGISVYDLNLKDTLPLGMDAEHFYRLDGTNWTEIINAQQPDESNHQIYQIDMGNQGSATEAVTFTYRVVGSLRTNETYTQLQNKTNTAYVTWKTASDGTLNKSKSDGASIQVAFPDVHPLAIQVDRTTKKVNNKFYATFDPEIEDTAIFTARFKNTGKDTAYDTEVWIDLPEEYVLASTPDGLIYDAVNHRLTGSIDVLDVDETKAYSISLTSQPGTVQVGTDRQMKATMVKFYNVFDKLYDQQRSTSIYVNQAPTATDGEFIAREDTNLTGSLDRGDLNGDQLTYSVLTEVPASVGSFFFTEGNAWTFVPALNYTGDDNLIEVQVSDNLGGLARAAITIDIVAINDAPIINNQSFETDEEIAIVNQAIAFTDVDSTAWTFALVGDEPETGSLTLRSNGTFDYTSPTDFYGDVSFQVKVTDNGDQEDETLLFDEAIITIVVRNVQDSPDLSGDTTETKEDTPVEGTVTARDSDPDDILTYSIESDPTYGTVTISKDNNGQATYRYVPALNYHGLDRFQVRVSDGNGNSDLAYVDVTVTPVNDQPVVDDQLYTTKEDMELTRTIPASDVDSENLKFTMIQTISEEEGTLVLATDGSVVFHPAQDFVGDAVFQVRVSDQEDPALTDTATITIRVTPVNDPPIASNLFISIAEDTSTAGSVTASDVDGDALTYELDEQSLASLRGTVTKTGGSSSPGFFYTPKGDDYGTESFIMIVRDPDGQEARATITVQVTAVNDLPVTPNQEETMDEDGEEIQGALDVTDADPTDLLVSTLTRAPIHGLATVATSGAWTYEPHANWHGVETFDIGTDDGQEGTALATITVIVRSINDEPTTVDYWHTTQQNLAIPGQVVAKDADLQNIVFGGTADELVFSIDTPALHGQVGIDENTGKWRYEPNLNYVGEDAFTVHVQDLHGGHTTSQIHIQVIGQDGGIYPSDNTPPVTGNQTILLKPENLGTIVFGQVIGVDPNGDELVYSLLDDADTQITIDDLGVFKLLGNEGQWELTVAADADLSKLPKIVSVKISDQRGGQAVARIYFSKEKNEYAMNGIVADLESFGNTPSEEQLIGGALITLYDEAGSKIGETTSTNDGQFTFGQQAEGIYRLVIEKEDYAVKNHEFYFDASGDEWIYLSPYGFNLAASPRTLVMDGKSISDLLATLTDLQGEPVAGWTVNFQPVEDGAFTYGEYLDGSVFVTDEKGQVLTSFKAADLASLDSHVIPLIVEARTGQTLKARDQILLIFSPSVIEGIVIDQKTGQPVEGARVMIEEDLDGDGIIDYRAEQRTGVDGRYSIPIPLGNSRYTLSITKPMQVNGQSRDFTFRQIVDAGEITGSGDHFYAEKTVSGILLERGPDGEEGIPLDLSRYALEVMDENGLIRSDVHAVLHADGTFTISGVEPNETYRIKPRIIFDGQTLYLPGIEVMVSENGEIQIAELLVDPFGTVSNKANGEIIEGAEVTLYYADTERNRNAGRPINQPVVLPDHPLALSNNENPQFSTSEGKYGYMVYPFTDYYLLVEADEYANFDSRKDGIISVENEIVIYDIKMSKSGFSIIHKPGTLELELRAKTQTPRVEAGQEAQVDLYVTNHSNENLSEVVVRSLLPAEISPVIPVFTEGMRIRIVGDELVITLYNVNAGETITVPVSYRTNGEAENGTVVRMEYRISPLYGIMESDQLNAQAGFLIIASGQTGHHDRYLYGYPDLTVQPERAVSRAESVAMVVRIMKLEGGSSKTTVFDKELEGHWARNNIAVALEHGLIEGYLTGWFKPDQAMTRAEFSTLVARVIDLDRTGDAKAFWAENTMERLLDYGLLQGDPDGNLRPDDPITRAEAVTILNRLLMRGPLQGIDPYYTDLMETHWAYGDLIEATYNHDFKFLTNGEEAENYDLEKPIDE